MGDFPGDYPLLPCVPQDSEDSMLLPSPNSRKQELLAWGTSMRVKVATLHEADDRSVARFFRVNTQRRVPSRRARPFPEAFLPIFRHEPLPVLDQATGASCAVPGYAAAVTHAQFTITKPLVIGEQLGDGFGLLVPCDRHTMSADIHCRAWIAVCCSALTLLALLPMRTMYVGISDPITGNSCAWAPVHRSRTTNEMNKRIAGEWTLNKVLRCLRDDSE